MTPSPSLPFPSLPSQHHDHQAHLTVRSPSKKVVSDKYNYDDDGGNRIYSGSFARTTSASHKGRLMINAYRYCDREPQPQTPSHV
jgi:hypothetical protein